MEGTEQQKAETTRKEEKLDLSNLQDFHFGTNWTESDPNSGAAGSESTSSGRGRSSWREGDSQPKRRDRRPTERFAQNRSDGRRGSDDGGGSRSFSQSPRSNRGVVDFEPTVDVMFLVEETGFSALCRAMRQSCRTYELFEIARLILAKPERFTVSLQKRANEEGKAGLLFLSVPDEHPFESEEEAVAHVLSQHSKQFFEAEEVEREAPRGNFQFVNRCSYTGEILGAPNHHLYSQTITQHHATRLSNVPFDRFKNSIETVREPEAIEAWLEKMKKGTRYVFAQEAGVEGEERPTFDSFDEARGYLLQNFRNRVVRSVKTAHLPGKKIEELVPGSLRQSIEWMLERQRRFPLDTSNVLRGRLRRQKFQIYKKGAHGISYVSSVRRKFRRPGQVFAESIQDLIRFIDENPMIPASDLPKAYLGIEPTTSSVQGEPSGATIDEDPRLKKLLVDLRWLLAEGYVTEFSDGRLSAPPPTEEPHPGVQKNTDGSEGITSAQEVVPDAEVKSVSAAETSPSNEGAVSPEPVEEVGVTEESEVNSEEPVPSDSQESGVEGQEASEGREAEPQKETQPADSHVEEPEIENAASDETQRTS